MNIIASQTNSRTGNTTVIFIGQGVFEKTVSGSVIIKAFPVTVVTDCDGNEIKRATDRSELAITLTEAQAAPFFSLFAAEYAAQKAAQAEAEARAAQSGA